MSDENKAPSVVAGEYNDLRERLIEWADVAYREGWQGSAKAMREAADALAAMQAQRDEAAAALFAEVRRNEAAQARNAALTEERSALVEHLETRDKFIVDQGLWAKFVASLPPARAALNGEVK